MTAVPAADQRLSLRLLSGAGRTRVTAWAGTRASPGLRCGCEPPDMPRAPNKIVAQSDHSPRGAMARVRLDGHLALRRQMAYFIGRMPRRAARPLHPGAAAPDQSWVDRSGAPGRPAPRNNWLLGATVAGSSRILRGKHIGGAGTGHRSRLTVRNPEFSQRTSRAIPVQREGCRHAAARMKEHRPGRAPDGAPAGRCIARCR